MDFLEKVKGLLMEPAKTFDALKEEPLLEATKYYAVIAAVYSALLALLFSFASSFFGAMMGFGRLGTMMGAGVGIGAAVIYFVMFMVFMIVGAFIGGAVLHIFVYIVGGRHGIAQTIKACMYGSTPSLLFGWIPVVNAIAMIWSLATEIVGIRQLHEISTGKAILAVILPLIIAFILAFIFAAALAFMFSSMGRPYGY